MTPTGLEIAAPAMAGTAPKTEASVCRASTISSNGESSSVGQKFRVRLNEPDPCSSGTKVLGTPPRGRGPTLPSGKAMKPQRV